MTTGTVTSKGQITIPVDVRKDLGLRPGSRVAFVRTDSGGYELRAETGSIRALKGIVARSARPVELEEMDQAIADGAAG
jgi:AbrB family looped-hinge helix DNA binding protein